MALNESEQRVTLHYLDKVMGMQLEAGKRSSNSLMLCFFASLTLLSVSFGGLSIEDKLLLLGARLQFNTVGLPLVGAWVVALLFIQAHSFSGHETRLRKIVQRLYLRCGLEEVDVQDPECNPLEFPNIFAILTSSRSGFPTFVSKFAMFVFGTLVVFLPTTSVIAAYVKVHHIAGHPWWWILSLILNLATVVAGVFIDVHRQTVEAAM